MRVRVLSGPALITLLAIFVAHGRSQALTRDEGRILALETAWNHAEQAKDVAALDQLLSPKLVYIDYDASLNTKEEFLAP